MHRSHRLALCLILAIPTLPALAQTHRMAPFSEVGTTISLAALRISPRAWEHFANAKLADQGNHEAEFNREFDRALAIEPNFANLYLLRASRSIRARRFNEALTDVLAAQRIEPNVVNAGTILASIYNGQHRFDDALLVLSAIHGTEAGTWQVAYEFTRAYLGRHDAEQALRTSALTLRIAPESIHDAILLRANAFVIAHRTVEAADEFRLFLASNPAPALAAEVQHAIEALIKQPAPRSETALASN